VGAQEFLTLIFPGAFDRIMWTETQTLSVFPCDD
jgi:hypothetical protein